MLALKIINPFFLLAMRILSLVVFLLTIVSAYGGRINPDYFTFPSVMVLFLPYLAIFTFLLTVFWAVSRKIFFTALGVLCLIFCFDSVKQAVPFGSSKKAEEGQQTFKIISWNVLHTQDIREPDYPGNRAVEFMINSGADVICLAELKNFGETELRNVSQQLKDSLFSVYPYHAGKKETDIKVLSKYPVERNGYSLIREGTHRFDFFEISFPDNRLLTVGMVHLYSYNLSDDERNVVSEIRSVEGAKESVKELKGSIHSKLKDAFRKRAENATTLREVIDELKPSAPLIICGDFNDVPASWTYNLIKGDDMKDAYIETNFGPAITYNLHMFYFHIDQMLYRGDLKALSLKVGKINTSDHYPLIGEFAFTNNP